ETGTVLGRRGNRGPDGVVQDVYPCAGDDAWVAVTVADAGQAQALAAVLATDELTDVAWPDDADRIDAALRAFVVGCDGETAVQRLVAAGVPAGVVRRPTVVARNPHLVDRGFYEEHV